MQNIQYKLHNGRKTKVTPNGNPAYRGCHGDITNATNNEGNTTSTQDTQQRSLTTADILCKTKKPGLKHT